MAVFSGKIIEAYYSNPDNTTVEIIYKEGTQAISYYIEVDYENPVFNELIEEYTLDQLQKTTVARIRTTNQKLQDIVNQQVKAKLATKDDMFTSLTNFLLEYDPEVHNEKLFAVKIKIFEDPRVKESGRGDMKKKIRLAKTPIETLIAYKKLIDND